MKAWSRQTASRYQALAAIPLETFANRISPIRLRKPTTTRIISEARTGPKDPRSRPLAMFRARGFRPFAFLRSALWTICPFARAAETAA